MMAYLCLAFILMISVSSQVAMAEPPAPSAASWPAAASTTPLTRQEAQLLATRVFLEKTGIKKYTLSVARLSDIDPDNLVPDIDRANILLFGFEGTEEYLGLGNHGFVHVNVRTREVLFLHGQ